MVTIQEILRKVLEYPREAIRRADAAGPQLTRGDGIPEGRRRIRVRDLITRH